MNKVLAVQVAVRELYDEGRKVATEHVMKIVDAAVAEEHARAVEIIEAFAETDELDDAGWCWCFDSTPPPHAAACLAARAYCAEGEEP